MIVLCFLGRRQAQAAASELKRFHASPRRLLNRILVEKEEINDKAAKGEDDTLEEVDFADKQNKKKIKKNVVSFMQQNDERFFHMQQILKVQVGEVLKMGVVDRGITDQAKVISVSKHEIQVDMGDESSWRIPPKPPIDLILAFPRPARLAWLFPVVSSLGVGRILLIKAAKTEKGYLASHLYKSMNDKLRKLLMLGLSQASVDCWMPLCELYPKHDFREFLSDLDNKFPRESYLRLLAHPLKSPSETITFRRQVNNQLKVSSERLCEQNSASSIPFHALSAPESWNDCTKEKKIVIAVGPEGGWSDDEIRDLTMRGFVKVHMMGERVLRTDIAVPALLALAYEWYNQESRL